MSEPILESVDTPQHSGDPVTSDEFQYIWHAVIDEGTSVDHTFEDGDTDIVMTCLVDVNTKLLTIEVVEMLPQQQTGELPFIQLTFPDTREGQAAGIEAYLRLCAAAHIRFAHPGPPEVWPAGTQ